MDISELSTDTCTVYAVDGATTLICSLVGKKGGAILLKHCTSCIFLLFKNSGNAIYYHFYMAHACRLEFITI